MPTLATATRNAMADAAADLVDAGAGAGTLKLYTSGDAELGSITLADPAFGDAAAGVVTALGVPLTGTAGASGTVAYGKLFDSDSNEVLEITVGESGSGADAIIDSTTLDSGDTVQLDSMTLTVPAG